MHTMRASLARNTATRLKLAVTERANYSQSSISAKTPFAIDSIPLGDGSPASSAGPQLRFTPPRHDALLKNVLPIRPHHRGLPTSPLMDPTFLKAKEKPHAVKAKPRNDSSELHRQLLKNPYALALASPLRMCQITETLLPRFFLQGFHLVADPETGKPYYAPQNMKANRPHGPVTYILARQSLIARMHDHTAGYGKPPQARLLPNRIKHHPDAIKVYNKARFKSGMDAILLEQSRGHVCDMLLGLLKLKRGYMTGFSNWADIIAHSRQAAVVLWIGGDGDSGNATVAPGEFATVLFPSSETKMSREIPVHDLRRLLGQEKLSDLRKAASSAISENGDQNNGGLFRNHIISIRGRNMTAQLQNDLWWLQGYLAEHGVSD